VVRGFLILGKLVSEEQKEESSSLPEQNRLLHFNSTQGSSFEPRVPSVREGLPFRSNPRFLVEVETQTEKTRKSKKAVGVDLGIARLATLSDGRFLENPKPLERSLDRVRVLQSVKKKVSFQKLA